MDVSRVWLAVLLVALSGCHCDDQNDRRIHEATELKADIEKDVGVEPVTMNLDVRGDHKVLEITLPPPKTDVPDAEIRRMVMIRAHQRVPDATDIIVNVQGQGAEHRVRTL